MYYNFIFSIFDVDIAYILCLMWLIQTFMMLCLDHNSNYVFGLKVLSKNDEFLGLFRGVCNPHNLRCFSNFSTLPTTLHATSTSINKHWRHGPKSWMKNIRKAIVWKKFLEGLKLNYGIFIGTSDIFNPMNWWFDLTLKICIYDFLDILSDLICLTRSIGN